MKKLNVILATIVLLANNGPSFAEGTWNYYTDCNSIGVIAAHGDYVWCATTSGVVRWNRHDKTHIHEVYASPDRCCWYQANNMVALAVDDEGTAWFGNAYHHNYQNWLFSFDGSVWETYTMENSGLPGGAGKLNFDRNGMLWISTANGTASYDGTTWKNYTEDGEGNKLIYVLGIDRLNVKWFRTEAGVSCLDGITWTSFTLEDGVPDRVFYSMSVGEDNVKWFSLDSWALVSFDGETWTVHDGLEWVASSVAVDADNIVWCGGTGGLARYDGNNFTYYTTENSGIPDNVIRAIAIDDDGVLWISNGELEGPGRDRGRGLTRFDGETWEVWRAGGPEYKMVYSVAVEHNNVKWFGVSSRGLTSFDGEVWKTYILPDTTTIATGAVLQINPTIYSIAEDRENVLWLTYNKSYKERNDDGQRSWYNHGVMSFDGTTFTDYPAETTGAPDWYTSRIAVDYDNVKWFDRTSFDGTTWTTYTDDGSGHTLEREVAVDLNNVKWFGATGGVASFDGSVWEYYAVTDIGRLQQIAVDDNNVKWFLSNKILVSFDGSTFEQYDFPETKTFLADDIVVDSHGVKWFISHETSLNGAGLTSFDGYEWTYHRDDFWLVYSSDRLAVDHDDVIWVASYMGGIASYDPGPYKGNQTLVGETVELPSPLSIRNNYPNPFNPSTTIEFSLPKKGFVSLIIYNISGQKVRELVSENLPAGLHHVVWDGTDENGHAASSGIYISQLRMGKKAVAGKMLLIK